MKICRSLGVFLPKPSNFQAFFALWYDFLAKSEAKGCRFASNQKYWEKTENEIKTRVLVFGYERLSDAEKKRFFLDVIEKNSAC